MLLDFYKTDKRTRILITFGIIFLYLFSTFLSIKLSFKEISSAPAWYASGVAFAALIIFGKRIIPSVLVGAFLSTVFLLFGKMPGFIVFILSLITVFNVFLQLILGYSLISVFKCEMYFLNDVRSTFVFAVIALIISVLAASIEVFTGWGFSLFESQFVVQIWLRWWLSHTVGILLVTPFIIAVYKNRKLDISLANVFEVVSLFALVFIFTQIIFGDWIKTELVNSLPFLIIPLLLWIAFRFTHRETTLAAMLVAIIAIWGSVEGTGPFIRDNVDSSLLVLQLYLGVMATVAVVLSVSVQERERAIGEFKEISDSLERRVNKRTDELATLNKELLVEVNHRKKAEADLKETQDRNQALLSSLPDLIFLHSRQGVFLDFQAQGSNLLYMKPEVFLGKNIDDVFPAEIAQNIKELFQICLETGQTQTYEYDLEMDSEHKYFEARLSICGDDRIMSVVRDITDKKRSEEERQQLEEQVRHAQKLESLGVLAGGIAHDFNNLLTAIMGNTGLAMMQTDESGKIKNNLQSIEKASLRAADLCQQLLAYSGKGKFIVEAVNMNDLVNEMSKLLDVSKSKKVKIDYKFEENIPSFEADATQIRQVVMNLITNASEAINEKPGKITIRTGVKRCSEEYLSDSYFDNNLEAGEYVFLEVQDTGSGMNEDTISKIFDPFFTTKFTGRGLGLAAVVGIVRGHRGAIRIDSILKKGTTFTVLFPILDHKEETIKPKTAEAFIWRGEGTVLVVDDDAAIRALGKATLEQAGLDVLTAFDGRDAVKIYRQKAKDISLVLMDMTMPNLNGDEAFKKLQQIKADVKVILSSGYSEQEATRKFGNAGLCGFLQKPYKPDDLLIKVKNIIAKEN